MFVTFEAYCVTRALPLLTKVDVLVQASFTFCYLSFGIRVQQRCLRKPKTKRRNCDAVLMKCAVCCLAGRCHNLRCWTALGLIKRRSISQHGSLDNLHPCASPFSPIMWRREVISHLSTGWRPLVALNRRQSNTKKSLPWSLSADTVHVTS